MFMLQSKVARMALAEAVTAALVLVTSSLLLISWWRKSLKTCNLPPGPPPLPLIGNLLQIRRGETLSSLLALRKKYGDVFTMYLGTRKVVVLCGYKAVKEALIDQGEDFSGRGDMPSMARVYKDYGIAFTTNMEWWKQLRHFSLMTLKNFGIGKRSIEERIQAEVQTLIEEYRNTKALPFDPRKLFGCVSANVICSVMIGKCYDFKDPEFLTLIDGIKKCFEQWSSGWGQLYDVIPHIMDHIPGPHHKIISYMDDLLKFVSKRVQINQDTLDPSSPRDYIDCFLNKMGKEKENPSSAFNMTNLVTSILQIIFAGIETSSTTMTYGFLMLLKYPEIKEKLHQEIDSVIGKERPPSIQDRRKMPFMEAVINEIQRFCNILPLGVPHTVIRDTLFRGYTIPKGTNVFPLLHTVLLDPQHFRDPEQFDPMRFLDEKGDLLKREALIPFSTGKRTCPGEGLVRMVMFLIFTTILQNFEVKPLLLPKEIDVLPLTSGFGNVPKPYKFCAVPRT
ncbi:cytochrome P450 2G1-like isoform X1 [Ambystoma mexicanum]|uniref:cytochrome P450 2G1-like isoform X1 n=1 Tax=Ambystoma mexicanum TaxID=8296 RepID=UPI0037E79436